MTDEELRDRFRQRLGEGEELLWVGEGTQAGIGAVATRLLVVSIALVLAMAVIVGMETGAGSAMVFVSAFVVFATLVAVLIVAMRKRSACAGRGRSAYAVTSKRVIRERLMLLNPSGSRYAASSPLDVVSSLALEDLSPHMDRQAHGPQSVYLMRKTTQTSFSLVSIPNAPEAYAILTDAVAKARARATRYIAKPTIEQVVKDRLEPGEEIVETRRPSLAALMRRGALTFLPHATTLSATAFSYASRHWWDTIPIAAVLLTGVMAGIAAAVASPPIYVVTNRRAIKARLQGSEVAFADTPLETVRFARCNGSIVSVGVFAEGEVKFPDMPKPKEFLAAINAGTPRIEGAVGRSSMSPAGSLSTLAGRQQAAEWNEP
jgi:hypothetical protein